MRQVIQRGKRTHFVSTSSNPTRMRTGLSIFLVCFLIGIAILLTILFTQPPPPFIFDPNQTFSNKSLAIIQVENYSLLKYTIAAQHRWDRIILNSTFPLVIQIQSNQTYCGEGLSWSHSFNSSKVMVRIRLEDASLFMGNTLGTAESCLTDTQGFVRMGMIRISTKVMDLYPTKVIDIITHELGHVLGLGVLWESRKLIQGFSYIGSGGRRGLLAIGGTGDPLLEDLGGASTEKTHWRSTEYPNELMSGVRGTADSLLESDAISLLTVYALMDLGYSVNRSNADPYHL